MDHYGIDRDHDDCWWTGIKQVPANEPENNALEPSVWRLILALT
jgi:hypothetical protein